MVSFVATLRSCSKWGQYPILPPEGTQGATGEVYKATGRGKKRKMKGIHGREARIPLPSVPFGDVGIASPSSKESFHSGESRNPVNTIFVLRPISLLSPTPPFSQEESFTCLMIDKYRFYPIVFQVNPYNPEAPCDT
jgi:hypothetical protein